MKQGKMNDSCATSLLIENTLIDHASSLTVGPIKFDNDKHTMRVVHNNTVFVVSISKAT
jgi:hypothetical protein